MNRELYGLAFADGGFRRTVESLRRYGASPQDAAEGAQAAWVKGLGLLGQLKDPARIVGWINAIAINMFRDEAVRRRRFSSVSSAGEELRILPSVNMASVDLHRAMKRCPPAQRALLEAVLVGRTAAELAAELHISEGAAVHRLSRARRALRKAMTAA